MTTQKKSGGSVKSDTWALRFTTDQIMNFETLFEDKFMWLAYVDEKGSTTGKRHYHVLIHLINELTRNKLDTLINKFFPDKGNAFRSVKLWDGNNRAFQYMHKENVPVTFGHREDLLTTAEYQALATEEPTQYYSRLRVSFDELRDKVVDHISNKYTVEFLDSLPTNNLRTLVARHYLDAVRVAGLKLKPMPSVKHDLMNIMFALNLDTFDGDLIESMIKF